MTYAANIGNDNYLSVGGVPDVDFGTWSGGSLSTTVRGCIASANERQPSPPSPPAEVYPYQASVDNRNPGSDFYLYLNNDTSSPDNARITVVVEHRDIIAGSAFETLTEGVYDTHYHLGRFHECLGSGDNSELRISIPEANLTNKVAGVYHGQFRLEAVGGTSGTKYDRTDFDLILTVQSANVRISGMDDMALGTYVPGTGNVQQDEHFCVQSLADNSAYRISVSSSNQTPAGEFRLKHATDAVYLPVEVLFSPVGSGSGTEQITNNTISALGSPDSFCGGSDNATITVRALEADVQASPSGSYGDTLVLLVVPE